MKIKCHAVHTALCLALAGLVVWSGEVAAGTWTAVATAAPGNVQLMMLLTDGTVLCFNGSPSAGCYRLTPSSTGSYVNGTWTTMASMGSTRRYFSSQVLQSGKVMVAGAEYGTGGATTEIYDPFANTWTSVAVPGGLLNNVNLGDGSNSGFRDSGSVLLPDGRMLVAPVYPTIANQTLIYNPFVNTWSAGPTSLGNQNEASWVKLPDDSILTVDINSTTTERFIPSQNRWIPDNNCAVNLYGTGSEIGAALLLPDGRAFYLGGNSSTAFYTPSGATNAGTWAAGPAIPNSQACPDAPAAMLPNGRLFFACNPIGSPGNTFPTNVSFYEFNPAANSYTRQNSPTGGLTQNGIAAYQTSFLALPDGNILYSSESSQLYLYAPGGAPIAAGKPTIASIQAAGGGSFHLVGTKLNGLSAGASYGDDEQMDSNYPLVRLSDGGGNVSYATTFNWSSTGVATGNTPVSTEFFIPANISQSGGPYSLVAVANGIASDAVFFAGPVWVDFNYFGAIQLGTFPLPFKTLTSGANAVNAGGTIFIKAGARIEPVSISKAMTIMSAGGDATIYGQ